MPLADEETKSSVLNYLPGFSLNYFGWQKRRGKESLKPGGMLREVAAASFLASDGRAPDPGPGDSTRRETSSRVSR